MLIMASKSIKAQPEYTVNMTVTHKATFRYLFLPFIYVVDRETLSLSCKIARIWLS